MNLEQDYLDLGRMKDELVVENSQLRNAIKKAMRTIESGCGTFDNPRRMTLEELHELYSDLRSAINS